MKYFILALMLTAFTARAESGSEIRSQYFQLRKTVEGLKPEYDVGGYLSGKRFGDHEILWHLAEELGDAEVIRIYREKKGDQAFNITFHRNNALVPGRRAIRRFVGPERSGWRNDTIDEDTEEYLGSQGEEEPRMDARDRAIMKRWLE